MPNVTEIWEPKPPGTLWATPGLLMELLYLYRFTSRCIIDHSNQTRLAHYYSTSASRRTRITDRYEAVGDAMSPQMLLAAYFR